MVADEVVYIGSKDHILYALDTRTDNKLWNYTTGDSLLYDILR